MSYRILTKRGYDMYAVTSALQKSIRRADVKVAGYMALELFPEYAEHCWKRLLTISAEDCAGIVTQEIKALYDSFHIINKNVPKDKMKGRLFISKAVIILCTVGHNRDADLLSNFIYDKKKYLTDELISQVLEDDEKQEIPDYAYDIHTLKGKMSGKTRKEFFKEEEDALANRTASLFEFDYLMED